jgi:hypothetical protein
VRCINTVAAVNEGGLETVKFVDQDAVVSIMAKEGGYPTPRLKVSRQAHTNVLQRRPKRSTNLSKTSGPASPKRRWIFLAATARSFQGRILRDSWFYLRISRSSPCTC